MTKKADELDKLIERARKGDKSVLPALREAITPESWKTTGDLAWQARRSLIEELSGGNEFTKEAVGRRTGALRDELALASDGMLEQLLIDRISTDWLALHHAEAMRNQNMSGATFKQAEYFDWRVNQCQRRYLAAIRTLAQVRRLMRPFIQVNIAEKQINVAS